MELISEYLAADLSADASADALAIINIGQFKLDTTGGGLFQMVQCPRQCSIAGSEKVPLVLLG